jgi:thioredoxin-like negative regulator of GroEL
MASGAHLLFFTTGRSGPGRRMESLLAQLARKERGRLRVSRVDAESSEKLAATLGVTEIPTLVLLVDRKPVARLEGRASSPQIEEMLDAHLDPGNPDSSLAA